MGRENDKPLDSLAQSRHIQGFLSLRHDELAITGLAQDSFMSRRRYV